VLYVSLSTWDTENDAREFFDAYLKRAQLRYPDAALIDASSTDFSKRFRTSEGIVTIGLEGSRVTVAEGVPDNATLKSLLKVLR